MIQALLDAGLVTDMTISIVPVVLADGVPLVRKRGVDIGLDLVEKLGLSTRRETVHLVRVVTRRTVCDGTAVRLSADPAVLGPPGV